MMSGISFNFSELQEELVKFARGLSMNLNLTKLVLMKHTQNIIPSEAVNMASTSLLEIRVFQTSQI
jgi:hypothetical protein